MGTPAGEEGAGERAEQIDAEAIVLLLGLVEPANSQQPGHRPSVSLRRLAAWVGMHRSGYYPEMSKPTDQLDHGAVREELERRRNRTRERVAVLAKRPELGSAQGFGKRIGDGTTEAISRLTEIGVGQSLESTLTRTERALSKLDEDSYGACDACGQAIAPARLQAMPDSVMCLACAASERRSYRPSRR
jgi:DnaK suppressor protein